MFVHPYYCYVEIWITEPTDVRKMLMYTDKTLIVVVVTNGCPLGCPRHILRYAHTSCYCCRCRRLCWPPARGCSQLLKIPSLPQYTCIHTHTTLYGSFTDILYYIPHQHSQSRDDVGKRLSGKKHVSHILRLCVCLWHVLCNPKTGVDVRRPQTENPNPAPEPSGECRRNRTLRE